MMFVLFYVNLHRNTSLFISMIYSLAGGIVRNYRRKNRRSFLKEALLEITWFEDKRGQSFMASSWCLFLCLPNSRQDCLFFEYSSL